MDSNNNAPKRVLIASALTVLAVPALLWVNLRGGDDSKGDPTSLESPISASTTTDITIPPPPPVRYEVAEDWQIRGHSRFSDTEAAKRSSVQTENLVIGAENIPEPLDFSSSSDEDATTTTQRVITLAEMGVYVAVTDPNYLTTTTARPVWTTPRSRVATTLKG